jgi:hypothetical protein
MRMFEFCRPERVLANSDLGCRGPASASQAVSNAYVPCLCQYVIGGKSSLRLSFHTGAPTDVPPRGIGQHVFGRYR